MANVLAEYDMVQEGVALGYLCSVDGKPCEFETRHSQYGADADGNRWVWVAETLCVKCGEPPNDD